MEQNKYTETPIKIFAADRRLTMHLAGLWQGARAGGERCARADLFLASLSEEL
ncbi:MAG: hypothetical protein O7D27_10820 [Alphaproteobacteria bacterium]|nr:hypothetical protein [Alphaproteobacteria bacterium]MCZ6742636.1 hypothetical protein [Alphaproteobacteria bacterium]